MLSLQRFEFVVLGKGVVSVNGVSMRRHGPTEAVVLGTRNVVHIGPLWFFFMLPNAPVTGTGVNAGTADTSGLADVE